MSHFINKDDHNPDESSNEREVTTPSWKDVHGSWSKVRLGV